MNRFARSMTGIVAACLVALAVTATTAHAQDAAAGGQRPPALQQGPMVVEPIGSGFVLMPEVRWTELNHAWGTQFGASGGWVVRRQVLLRRWRGTGWSAAPATSS